MVNNEKAVRDFADYVRPCVLARFHRGGHARRDKDDAWPTRSFFMDAIDFMQSKMI